LFEYEGHAAPDDAGPVPELHQDIADIAAFLSNLK
jgi:hypothetical protein